nr:unnamed protein product [Callosobruchus chinensis]
MSKIIFCFLHISKKRKFDIIIDFCFILRIQTFKLRIHSCEKTKKNTFCRLKQLLEKSSDTYLEPESTSRHFYLLTLYKAQKRPSLQYCSHICGAAGPTTLPILDAVQRSAIRLIGYPTLTCHLQPLSHRHAVGDLSLLHRYSNGLCSFKLISLIPPLTELVRYTRGTSSSHPKTAVLHISRTELYERTFVARVSRALNGLPGDGIPEPASEVPR